MTIWRVRIAYWITKVTNTRLEYVISYLLLHHGNTGCTNAPHSYVVLTLLLLVYIFIKVFTPDDVVSIVISFRSG
jgi:hypothetical protein